MQHGDRGFGTAWARTRPDDARGTRRPRRRGSRPVPAAQGIAAGVGLALTLAVGTTTVTATLLEAGDRTTTTAVVTPAAPSPQLLRLWGVRPTPDGTLVPFASSDPVPRTALEQLYADLLLPSVR